RHVAVGLLQTGVHVDDLVDPRLKLGIGLAVERIGGRLDGFAEIGVPKHLRRDRRDLVAVADMERDLHPWRGPVRIDLLQDAGFDTSVVEDVRGAGRDGINAPTPESADVDLRDGRRPKAGTRLRWGAGGHSLVSSDLVMASRSIDQALPRDN